MPRSAVFKLVMLSLASVAAVGVWVTPAHAAFGGTPGRIAYVRPGANGGAQIFTSNPDGSDERLLATGTDPAWSPNGFRLAFDDGKDIWVVNADGSGLRSLTQNSNLTTSVQPAWNWDGTQLAFSQRYEYDQAPPAEIYTMAFAGGQRTQVTNDPADALHPAWAPNNGTPGLIVFDSTRVGSGEVFAVFADGSGERQLSHGAGGHNPDWNPNGAQVVFRDDASHLEVVDADGSNQHPLTTGPALDDDPVFAPDGTSIAFQRTQNNATSIWKADKDGSNAVEVTTPTSAHPNWAIVPAPRSGADLAVTIDVTGGASRTANDIRYVATVTNDGPQAASPPVVLQFTLAEPYTTATTSSDGTWHCGPDQTQPRQIDCTRDSALAPGSASTVTFALPPDQGGCPSDEVHAVVSSATPDPDTTNNTANQAGAQSCVQATQVTNESNPNTFSPPSGGLPSSPQSSTSSPPQPPPVLPIANSNPRVLGSTVSSPGGPSAPEAVTTSPAAPDPTSPPAGPASTSPSIPAQALARTGPNVNDELVVGALLFAIGMGAVMFAEILGLVPVKCIRR